MSYILSSGANLRGRDNSPGGSEIYIAEHANIVTVDVDASNEYVSGITMSGSTYFYKFQMPRENINFTNQTEISIPNGVFIFKPMVNFNLPGLKLETLQLFDVLVRKSVCVIVKTNENKYFIIGKDNGLDLTANSNFALGLSPTDLIGSTIELEGLESSRIYEIDPSVASSIIASIVTE